MGNKPVISYGWNLLEGAELRSLVEAFKAEIKAPDNDAGFFVRQGELTIVEFTGFFDYRQEITYGTEDGAFCREPLRPEILDRPMTAEARQTLAQILKLDEDRIRSHLIPDDKFDALMKEFDY